MKIENLLRCEDILKKLKDKVGMVRIDTSCNVSDLKINHSLKPPMYYFVSAEQK